MDAGRGERGAVVGADRVGQADLPEEGPEHGLRKRRLHRPESPTHQQGPAEMIRHRQGIAVLSIARLELPFEIGGPYLIRMVALHRGRARVGPRAATPILSEQIVALEDVVEGTACRPRPRRVPIAEDP